MPYLEGSEIFKGRKWTSNIKLSGINAPAEEFITDPNLPILGIDPRYPTTDQIVIPRGRLLAVKPGIFAADGTGSSYGKAVLTIADGVSYKPLGYTDTNIFKANPQRRQWLPKLVKQELIEVPYINLINNAYGQLNNGDRITAYYGTPGRNNPNPDYKGRIVKWVRKDMYVDTLDTPSASVVLANALYGAFTPSVLLAYTSGGTLSNCTGTTWVDNVGWVASFAGAVKQVVYKYGQEYDQIAGEVLHIEPVDSEHEFSGWQRWVEDNFTAWEYQPVTIRVPTTTATTTSGYAAIASNGGVMNLSRPIIYYKNISVYADATVVDQNGDAISYTSGGAAMPLSDIPYNNWSYGKWYTIDPFTGTLTFASNVTLTGNVKVVYEYETSYRDGRLWGAGIQGLTDGNLSGMPGTPAHLDAPNMIGALRVMVD